MNILERLRDPEILAQMTLGEKLGGALVVTVIGMLVCMVALTAIMYAIKLMHVIFREKEEAVPVPEAGPAPVLPDMPPEAAAILSPEAGTVTLVNAFKGANVKEGDLLLLLEVGGVTYEVTAPCDGTVLSLCVKEKEAVQPDAALVIFREKGAK